MAARSRAFSGLAALLSERRRDMLFLMWSRRKFLNRGAATAGAVALASRGNGAWGAASSGLRGRFVTHVSVVRVNQIEVTPDRSIGEDEAAANRVEHIRSRREAFARGC